MPIVDITLLEGRTPEAKARLMKKVTEAIVDAIGAPPENVRVILRELPHAHYSVAGVPMGGGKESAKKGAKKETGS